MPEITVKNLYFKYHNSDKYILKDINVTIKANENIAIVGENGSGKGTLAKCLLGLYLLENGTILYDGIELNTIEIDSTRKLSTAIFQDFVKYNISFKR